MSVWAAFFVPSFPRSFQQILGNCPWIASLIIPNGNQLFGKKKNFWWCSIHVCRFVYKFACLRIVDCAKSNKFNPIGWAVAHAAVGFRVCFSRNSEIARLRENYQLAKLLAQQIKLAIYSNRDYVTPRPCALCIQFVVSFNSMEFLGFELGQIDDDGVIVLVSDRLRVRHRLLYNRKNLNRNNPISVRESPGQNSLAIIWMAVDLDASDQIRRECNNSANYMQSRVESDKTPCHDETHKNIEHCRFVALSHIVNANRRPTDNFSKAN